MVEIVSAIVGAATIVLFVVVVLSYAALYLLGKTTTTESDHYVNTRDVETARRETVRNEELVNTSASVQDERPVPQIGEDE